MLSTLFDTNKKEIAKLKRYLDKVNALEPEIEKLTQEELRNQTKIWQEDLSKHEGKYLETNLEKILPKAFAMVREATKRTLGKRHFDVQIMGGVALHFGKIAEQKTGEGKTLTATLALYLNALSGKGAHLVTANEYLAKHGAGWMAPIYHYLGLKVGILASDSSYIYDPEFDSELNSDSYTKFLKPCSKKESYQADITYGTNHEFGFDYLRDNMVNILNQKNQSNPRGEQGAHFFAVVDEVDFVLIDVARTPLIISAPDAEPTERYYQSAKIVKSLIKDTDYEVEEKFHTAVLTDHGIRKVEKMLSINNLYEQDFEMVHLIEQSLKAYALYTKDKDYLVKDNKIVIIDQFTGRLLPTNRYSQGLHQAIEAKENCPIMQESKTMAEISYQNYFRMYEKLSGMTGTAETEAEEFKKIYNLDVVVIPTNNPIRRIDHPDIVYKTETAKYVAVAGEIAIRHEKGQPVLVGTTSVEKSELLHELLKRKKIPHEILNAKNHEKEAGIIAQAGRKGAVTVSTNMAGRGVDILLGGENATLADREEVISLGGLFVVGTERHESRRIDNQLRGRAGRQGDIGESRFYISMQDSLMRIFGGSHIEAIMDRMGVSENIPIESKIITNTIRSAQKRVEGFYFDERKRRVEFDDVMNVHRSTVYKLRDKILELGFEGRHEEWFLEKLIKFGNLDVFEDWNKIKALISDDKWTTFLSQLTIPVIDLYWMNHLVEMDQVKEGISLSGYAQRDPMVEYKKEAHERFGILMNKIYSEVVNRIRNISADLSEKRSLQVKNFENRLRNATYSQSDYSIQDRNTSDGLKNGEDGAVSNTKSKSPVVAESKVGRNDPCFCGSGKKYKHCHGKS
jgi:preprotein translocase subunit SecA